MSSASKSRNGKKETDKPVWSRKYWTGSGNVEVAIWERMVGEGDQERLVYNTSLKKTYRQDDEYKESSSFRAEELPLVASALQQAFDWICSQLDKN